MAVATQAAQAGLELCHGSRARAACRAAHVRLGSHMRPLRGQGTVWRTVSRQNTHKEALSSEGVRPMLTRVPAPNDNFSM